MFNLERINAYIKSLDEEKDIITTINNELEKIYNETEQPNWCSDGGFGKSANFEDDLEENDEYEMEDWTDCNDKNYKTIRDPRIFLMAARDCRLDVIEYYVYCNGLEQSLCNFATVSACYHGRLTVLEYLDAIVGIKYHSILHRAIETRSKFAFKIREFLDEIADNFWANYRVNKKN
jgi:hypothetical protein